MASNTKYMIVILFSLFVTFTLVQSFTLRELKSKNPKGRTRSPIVYRRFVRRSPSVYAKDQYEEEIMEVFYIRRKPPMRPLTDEEIDQLIKCDFEPESEDCKENSTTRRPSDGLETTTARPTFKSTTGRTESHYTTTTKTSSTSTPSWSWIPTEAAKTTTPATTSASWPWAPTTPESVATTSHNPIISTPKSPTTSTTAKSVSSENDLPFLPDIPASEEETTPRPIDYDAEKETVEEGSGLQEDDEDFKAKRREENNENIEVAGDINGDNEEGDGF